jgi:hypothetical protein
MPGIDETESSFRVRQRNPGDFVKDSFRTISFGPGISAVIGKLKSDPKGSTKVQTVIFDKDKFKGKKAVVEWIRKHKMKILEAVPISSDEHILLSTKPDSIKTEDGFLLVKGTMLAPGRWNGLNYTSDNIEKSTIPNVKTSPTFLTVNHGRGFFDNVGVFTNLEKRGGRIEYEAIIDDSSTVNFIKNRMKTLQKAGIAQERAFEISSELYAKRTENGKTKELEATNIRIFRGSLVLEGACPPPHCTVNPIVNEDLKEKIEFDVDIPDCGCAGRIELATKCEAKFMNKSRTRYKKGFPGCVESKMKCAGLDKRHAEKMCNYIFWRRGGAGKTRNTIEEINREVLAEYFDSSDKEEYVEYLWEQIPEEIRLTIEEKNVEELEKYWEEFMMPEDGKESCPHEAIIAELEEKIRAVEGERDVLKEQVDELYPLKEELIQSLVTEEITAEDLKDWSVRKLMILAKHSGKDNDESPDDEEETDEEKKREKQSKVETEEKVALRHTEKGGETAEKKDNLKKTVSVDRIKI